MAFTNLDAKEINCKVAYFGAPQAGKTQNLRAIYSKISTEMKAGLVELSAEVPQNKYFDFLPLSLGQVYGYHLKMHLFSIPLTTPYRTLQNLILKGLDGAVFVVDSRVERVMENIDAFLEFKNLLKTNGFNLGDLPLIVQYNKRDLPGCVPLDILRSEFKVTSSSELEAIATEALGTMETLKALTKKIILKMAAH